MTGPTPPETLLLVDDEEMVLTSLCSFLGLETDYTTVPFTSPLAALAYAQDHAFNVVLSDYLMPEMDGISFLQQMKILMPEVPRILLTGYADKANAIQALNEVGLFQYIEKPWNNDDLLIILRNALEKRRLMNQLQAKLGEIDRAYAGLQEMQQAVLKAFV